jgi:hypothetical protein
MTSLQLPATPLFEAGHCANCFQPRPADAGHRPWLFCTYLAATTPHSSGISGVLPETCPGKLTLKSATR